jgi:membrane carboxypeptidase/penicillin-binding protein
MARALAGKPAEDFPRPDTVVTAAIDPATGKLAAEDLQGKHEEFYIAGTEPKGSAAEPAPEPVPVPEPVSAPEPVPAPARDETAAH